MKKLLITGICLCILLVSPWNIRVQSLTAPYDLVIEHDTMDAFFSALRDDRVVKCHELLNNADEKTHELFEQQAQMLRELVPQIPFIEDYSEADLLVSASECFSALGYVPVPSRQEQMRIILSYNYRDHPFLLTYDNKTVTVKFKFKHEHTKFSISDTYEELQQEDNYFSISRVDMKHGEGVLYLRPESGVSAFQSCMGSMTGNGTACLITEYEDFIVQILLPETNPDEAMAFMKEFEFEKHML